MYDVFFKPLPARAMPPCWTLVAGWGTRFSSATSVTWLGWPSTRSVRWSHSTPSTTSVSRWAITTTSCTTDRAPIRSPSRPTPGTIVCVYVCMYVCMYTCIHVCQTISMYCMYCIVSYTPQQDSSFMYALSMYVYIQYVCMYVYIQYVCMYVYIQYVCMYTYSMYVCIHTVCMYVYIQYVCIYQLFHLHCRMTISLCMHACRYEYRSMIVYTVYVWLYVVHCMYVYVCMCIFTYEPNYTYKKTYLYVCKGGPCEQPTHTVPAGILLLLPTAHGYTADRIGTHIHTYN